MTHHGSCDAIRLKNRFGEFSATQVESKCLIPLRQSSAALTVPKTVPKSPLGTLDNWFFWQGENVGKHLTDTEVKNAKLPAGKVEHNLSDLAGLYLRLRLGASGSTSKTWRFRYTYLGETKLLVLGTYPQMSLATAREDLFQRQKVLATGIDPKAAKEADEAKKDAATQIAKLGARPETLGDLFNQFIEKYAKKAYKDRGAYCEGTYRNHIGPYLGKVRLEHLTTAAYSDLLHRIRKKADTASTSKGHARTVGVVMDLLKNIYNWGFDSGYIDNNPAAALKAKNVGASKGEMGERVLSDDEIKQLVHILEYADIDAKWKHQVWLILSCTTRVGETTLAEVKHFDLKNLQWFIPKENQKKTRKGKPLDHVVDLSPFALRHVTALLDLANQRKAAAQKEGKDPAMFGNFLFPSRLVSAGEVPADEKTFAHQLRDRQQTSSAQQTPTAKRRTQNSAELILPTGKWTGHDLRRTSSTEMRNSGTDSDTVERCLNHIVGTQLERIYQKPHVLADMKNGWLALGTRLDMLMTEALADHATHNLYLQKSIQRKAEKKIAQAKKMKLTKAKNNIFFGDATGSVSPTK